MEPSLSPKMLTIAIQALQDSQTDELNKLHWVPIGMEMITEFQGYF